MISRPTVYDLKPLQLWNGGPEPLQLIDPMFAVRYN